MPAKTATNWEYVRSVLKSGKPGNRVLLVPAGEVCPVVTCDWCGRYGSPTWVRRWYLRPWGGFDLRRAEQEYEPEPVVCMACMNRVRRDWKAQLILLENQRLINKIKREASRVNAENRRRIA